MKSILTDSIYPMLLKKAFGRVGDLINHSWMEGQKVIMDEEFCPYGIKLGANQKEISRQRLKFNISAEYDFSDEAGLPYQVSFVDFQHGETHLVIQLHFIDKRLFLARIDFMKQLLFHRYEKLVFQLTGICPDKDSIIGILPFYIKDEQHNLLRIHNPMGYPSLMYYSSDAQIQKLVEKIQPELMEFPGKSDFEINAALIA
ncbi:hypothetical protein [Gaoshiqia sp. Z1-71]|uniref:hypothetical protein n=1 Tax=Gaoshiqia hydrogeniformans TaxID=3290090 RepID=UPI003BF8BE66